MIKLGAPTGYFVLPGSLDTLATDNVVQSDDGRVSVYYSTGGGTYYFYDTFSTIAAMRAGFPVVSVPLYGFVDAVGGITQRGYLTWDGQHFYALDTAGAYAGYAGSDALTVAALFVGSVTVLSPPWALSSGTPYVLCRSGSITRTLIATFLVSDTSLNYGPNNDCRRSSSLCQSITATFTGEPLLTFESAVFSILPYIA